MDSPAAGRADRDRASALSYRTEAELQGGLGGPPILVALGANLPGPGGRTPRATCEWAVDRLAALPGLRLLARSRWFLTAPDPPSAQPPYVNGAVRLAGAADPHALLAALHAIEAEAARVRAERNGPRTLDLDLLAVGGRVVADATLALPHPRLAERAFVLLPLCDVAPDWVHPVLHRTALSLLEGCGDAGAARPLP